MQMCVKSEPTTPHKNPKFVPGECYRLLRYKSSRGEPGDIYLATAEYNLVKLTSGCFWSSGYNSKFSDGKFERVDACFSVD